MANPPHFEQQEKRATRDITPDLSRQARCAIPYNNRATGLDVRLVAGDVILVFNDYYSLHIIVIDIS